MTDEGKKAEKRREKGKDEADLSPGEDVSECAVGMRLGANQFVYFFLRVTSAS